jgi:hypothetical protein
MPFSNPFDYFAGGEIFETVLPDFVAAFTFFTAVSYTVLGRRFGQHRAAVAMSASIGMALSVGLVWWEIEKGVSIRDLGPIAAGFAIILLASVMYPAIKQIGGTWAGAGIALGASILVGWALGLDWPGDTRIIQTVATVLLTVGVLAFLSHQRGGWIHAAAGGADGRPVRHDLSDLHEERAVADRVEHGLRDLRRQARFIERQPDLALR